MDMCSCQLGAGGFHFNATAGRERSWHGPERERSWHGPERERGRKREREGETEIGERLLARVSGLWDVEGRRKGGALSSIFTSLVKYYLSQC